MNISPWRCLLGIVPNGPDLPGRMLRKPAPAPSRKKLGDSGNVGVDGILRIIHFTNVGPIFQNLVFQCELIRKTTQNSKN